MKSITNYINEAKLPENVIRYIIELEKFAADSICIKLAFIDVFTSMLKETKENTVDLMLSISSTVSDYNDKVPPMFKKYSDGSTTNITVNDWNSILSYYLYPNDRDNYRKRDEIERDLNKQIIDGVDKPYSAFGITYSKKSLEKIYDIVKDKLSDTDLKNAIKELKSGITLVKKNYKEQIDAQKKLN